MSLRRRLALAVLLAVSGHQLALAAGGLATGQTGLRASDHGTVWGIAVALVVAGGVMAASVAGWRILALRLHLRLTPTMTLPDGATLLSTWALVASLGLVVFLAQENLEHLTQHGHLPLLEPLLSGHYMAVVPVFAGLGLLFCAAGLAIGASLRQLELAASARIRHRPPPRRIGSWRTLLDDHRSRTHLLAALRPRRGPPLPVSS
jgi:hypothetical protein